MEPAKKSTIWGGRRLIEEYGKNFDGDNLAETWELSAHPDGASVVASGEYAGLTLPEYIKKAGAGVLGCNCAKFEDFPILIKLIDAKDNLSVQVHPDNAYAREHENQYGKTEMWYVIDAIPGSALCYGCSRTVSREEFRRRIADGTLGDVMNMVAVKKGDIFFIEAGCVHAIGGGILLAEIQQNSNVTYRVYDYGRKGVDGKERTLHIDRALDVATLAKPREDYNFGRHIGACGCFVVDLYCVKDEEIAGEVTEDSFLSLLIVAGNGYVINDGARTDVKAGDSLFLPAKSGAYSLGGNMTVIATTIP